MRRPDPAERIRTLAYGTADALLTVPHLPVPAYTADADGRPLLLVRRSSPVVAALTGDPDLPTSLRLSDLAPVPLADRLRGQAWLHGWVSRVPADELAAAALRLSRLHPRAELLDLAADPEGHEQEWTVLTMDVAEAEIDDVWGSAVIEPEEYAAARPDPFVLAEPGLLRHLDTAHRGELAALFQEKFGPFDPMPRVRALALDRHGLWLRCSMPAADTPPPVELRVQFPEPVTDLAGLSDAYRRVFTRTMTRP